MSCYYIIVLLGTLVAPLVCSANFPELNKAIFTARRGTFELMPKSAFKNILKQ